MKETEAFSLFGSCRSAAVRGTTREHNNNIVNGKGQKKKKNGRNASIILLLSGLTVVVRSRVRETSRRRRGKRVGICFNAPPDDNNVCVRVCVFLKDRNTKIRARTMGPLSSPRAVRGRGTSLPIGRGPVSVGRVKKNPAPFTSHWSPAPPRRRIPLVVSRFVRVNEAVTCAPPRRLTRCLGPVTTRLCSNNAGNP